jgi:hypothetical protein
VDRLNREIGRFCNWLPDTDPDDSPYWQQYEAAEKVTTELVKRARKNAHGSHSKKEETILWEFRQKPEKLEKAMAEVHTDMGIAGALAHEEQRALVLA